MRDSTVDWRLFSCGRIEMGIILCWEVFYLVWVFSVGVGVTVCVWGGAQRG